MPAIAPSTSSPRRVAASRANGALSRGPLTPATKLKSQSNNRKHGLATSATFFLPTENPADFSALHASLLAEYHPITPHKQLLVDAMASARWLVLRALNFQRAAFDAEIARTSPLLSAPQRAALAYRNVESTLALGRRYQAKYQHQYDHAAYALILHAKNVNLPFEPKPRENVFLPLEPNPVFEHSTTVDQAATATRPTINVPAAPKQPRPQTRNDMMNRFTRSPQ